MEDDAFQQPVGMETGTTQAGNWSSAGGAEGEASSGPAVATDEESVVPQTGAGQPGQDQGHSDSSENGAESDDTRVAHPTTLAEGHGTRQETHTATDAEVTSHGAVPPAQDNLSRLQAFVNAVVQLGPDLTEQTFKEAVVQFIPSIANHAIFKDNSPVPYKPGYARFGSFRSSFVMMIPRIRLQTARSKLVLETGIG